MFHRAEYHTRCGACEAAIRIGDLIGRTEDGEWVHASCVDEDDRSSHQPDPCPVCWLVHPIGACDR